MRWLSQILAIIFVCTGFSWAGGNKDSSQGPAKASEKSASEKKKDEEKSKSAEEIDIPVPEGMPVYGIKFPIRDDKGKVVMIPEAEVANRLDEQHVEMQNLKIDAYDDEGKKIYIELPHAILNLETRILSGDTHALIRREDFQITGDGVDFNTKTRHVTVRGNVKMIILTADNP